jgi:hypothetical protein
MSYVYVHGSNRSEHYTKTALSQTITTAGPRNLHGHVVNMTSPGKSGGDIIGLGSVVVFLLLFFGYATVSTSKKPKGCTMALLGIVFLVVTGTVVLAIRSGFTPPHSSLYFDNATHKAYTVRVGQRAIGLPPMTHKGVNLDNGSYPLEILSEGKKRPSVKTVINADDAGGFLVYNIGRRNTYTYSEGDYVPAS